MKSKPASSQAAPHAARKVIEQQRKDYDPAADFTSPLFKEQDQSYLPLDVRRPDTNSPLEFGRPGR